MSGLAHRWRLLANGVALDPRRLFVNLGVGGYVFDRLTPTRQHGPSALNLLYQDNVNTLTGGGDPVGVALDRSQGPALESERVTNGAFNSDVSNWSPVVAAVTWDDGELKAVSSAGGQGAEQQIVWEIGELYRISGKIRSEGGIAASIRVVDNAHAVFLGQSADVTTATATEVVFYFRAVETNSWIYCRNAAAGTARFDDVSIKKVSGKHVLQSTTAAKPTYQGAPHRLVFDGGDYLSFGSPFAFDAGAFTLICAIKAAAQSSANLYSEGNTSTTAPVYSLGSGAVDNSKCAVLIRNDANSTRLSVEGSRTAFDDSWHIVTWRDAGNNCIVRVDGVEDINSDYTRSGVTPLDTATLGALHRTTVSGFLTGDMLPGVGVAAALSNVQIQAIERVLGQRLGSNNPL